MQVKPTNMMNLFMECSS